PNLRSGTRSRADCTRSGDAEHSCSQQRGAGENRCRAFYPREGPTRKAVLCLSRRRHASAHRGRVAEKSRWRGHGPRSLSWRDPYRRDRWTGDYDSAKHGCDPADHSRWQAARTCGHLAQALAELPTLAESGFPGFEVISWFGLLAPNATPVVIIDKVHAELERIVANADTRERIAQLGLEASVNSPEEFAVVIKTDTAKWAKVIRAANIKAE